jgi:hypothetical protein
MTIEVLNTSKRGEEPHLVSLLGSYADMATMIAIYIFEENCRFSNWTPQPAPSTARV